MANNFGVKDDTGTTKTIKTTDNAGVHTPHHNVDTLPSVIPVTQDTGRVYDGAGNALTTKRAFVNQAASGSNATIIALVASKKLRVLALAMVAGGTATDITFQSNNTAISPLFANAANGGAVLPFNPGGWFETASGEALKCTTGAGSSTGILVVYVEVA